MLETIITSLVTAAATAYGTSWVQQRKLRKEFEWDLAHARAQFMAELVTKELLEAEGWKKRSFPAIKARLGGFSDDELRKILVKAGAVRFHGENNSELWGLLSRNRDDL